MSGRRKSHSPRGAKQKVRGQRPQRTTPPAAAAGPVHGPEPKPLPPPDYSHFWPGFLRGVGTEPRQVTSIRGASGVSHALLAVGVDDDGQRLVLVSADTDARSAALAQADIQAALGECPRPNGARDTSRTSGRSLRWHAEPRVSTIWSGTKCQTSPGRGPSPRVGSAVCRSVYPLA